MNLLTLLGEMLARSEKPAHGGKPAVLIVEDESDFAEIVSWACGRWGFEDCVWASSPDDARRKLARKQFGFVILDQRFPGDVKGVEFANEVRRNFPATHIEFLTGFPSDFDKIARGQRFNITIKPDNADGLVSAVGEMLRQNGVSAPRAYQVTLASWSIFGVGALLGFALRAGWLAKLFHLLELFA